MSRIFIILYSKNEFRDIYNEIKLYTLYIYKHVNKRFKIGLGEYSKSIINVH